VSFALRFGTATGRGEGACPVGGRQASHLQTTLASSSAGVQSEVPVFPHHPITCSGTLSYEADGQFSCEHASAPPGDARTQLCVDHSIAILLLELAQEL
jgi:hypothetical protein